MQGSKPWRYTGEEANMDREDIKMLVNKWLDVYNDESLDFNPKSALTMHGEDQAAVSVQSFISSIPKQSIQTFVPAPSAA